MEYPTVVLRDISTDARKHMPEADFAGKGRSFPIETPEDVDAAARSIGRAGDDNYDSATLKKNIIRIAKRKGAAHLAKLPESWKPDIEACDDAAMTDRITAGAVEISASDVAAGRKRMPIAMLGTRYKGKQKIEITRPMLAQVVANFRKRDNGEVPVDYEHGTLDAPAGQPVPASGWIKAIDDAPDAHGVLWGDVEWTPKAAAMIAAKEYKYISPVIEQRRDNKDGDPQGWTLTSAALTNTPVLQGLPALVLSEHAGAGVGWKDIGRGDAADKEQKTVKVTKLILADRAANTVRVTLDDGTEAVVKLEGLETAPKVLRLSDVKRDEKSQELDFASLDTNGDVLIAGEVFRAQQAQMALSEAIKAGKILPAQRKAFEGMALSDLKGFRELVATMKPQVDLKARGTGATEGAPEGGAATELNTLVKARIAASEGKNLDYGAAMQVVLRERPELAAAYKAEMGGRK